MPDSSDATFLSDDDYDAFVRVTAVRMLKADADLHAVARFLLVVSPRTGWQPATP